MYPVERGDFSTKHESISHGIIQRLNFHKHNWETLLSIGRSTLVLLKPSTCIEVAAKIMKDLKAEVIVVEEGMKPVGIVTARDIVSRAMLKGMPLTLELKEIMSAPVKTIDLDSSTEEALRRMRDHQVNHLPVVNSRGEVEGVLSLLDLLKHDNDFLRDVRGSIQKN